MTAPARATPGRATPGRATPDRATTGRATPERAAPGRATAGRAARAGARGPAASILPGPRCGWPARKCGGDAYWHEPTAGTRRPWGWHDVQCQIPAADPALYPECSLINDHAGPCDYYRRQARGRTS